MEERLAELIYLYKKDSKPVDRKFVKYAFNIISEHYKLIGDVRLKNFSYGKVLGDYNNKDLIRIHRKNIIKDFYKCIKEYSDKGIVFGTGEYISILEVILHEIEHFKQYHELQYKNDAEGIILRSEIKALNTLNQFFKKKNNELSTTVFMLQYSKNLRRLYESSPKERLANIKSAEISQSVAKLLGDKKTEVLMKLRYYNYMLRGYNIGLVENEINSPTNFYLKYHGGMYNWNLIEELIINLSPIERIKLGLEDKDENLKQIVEESYKLSLRL